MKRAGFIFLILLLAGLACNGTGGTTVGSSQRCETTVASTICDGSVKSIKGAPYLEFETPGTAPMSVVVTMQLAVEEGSVRVYVKTPAGEEAGALASPGNPAVFTALADSSDIVVVYLEAQDEKASGIQYHIEIRPKP